MLRSKLWWALLFQKLPRKLQRKLAFLYPLRDQLLLTHIKAEYLDGSVLHFLQFTTANNLSPENLKTELSVSVHSEVPTMQTLLCYYQLPQCTGPLAIARFTCRNDRNEIIEVSEEKYARSSKKEEERFEKEVIDSVLARMDCFVISGRSLETFPKIAALMADDDSDVIQ